MKPSERTIAIDALMDACDVRFGTSGARGRVTDMTSEVCFTPTLSGVMIS